VEASGNRDVQRSLMIIVRNRGVSTCTKESPSGILIALRCNEVQRGLAISVSGVRISSMKQEVIQDRFLIFLRCIHQWCNAIFV